MATKNTSRAKDSAGSNQNSTSDKSRKETLNEKRLSIRRSIEDYLDDKRQKEMYGHLDELD